MIRAATVSASCKLWHHAQRSERVLWIWALLNSWIIMLISRCFPTIIRDATVSASCKLWHHAHRDQNGSSEFGHCSYSTMNLLQYIRPGRSIEISRTRFTCSYSTMNLLQYPWIAAATVFSLNATVLYIWWIWATQSKSTDLDYLLQWLQRTRTHRDPDEMMSSRPLHEIPVRTLHRSMKKILWRRCGVHKNFMIWILISCHVWCVVIWNRNLYMLHTVSVSSNN
jgi:hypothetical protein